MQKHQKYLALKTLDGRIVTNQESTIKGMRQKYQPEFMLQMQTRLQIPKTPQGFYEDFGPLKHDFERDEDELPVPVKSLTSYQIGFWNMDYGVALKSNKVGLTTSELLNDFWTRLQPRWAGFDCLVAAPKIEIANELVLKLKQLVNNSPKYSKYLIKRPDFEDFLEEKSKVSVMYIRNPYNSKMRSRIIAVGGSLSSVYSRMGINRIHITDPSLLKIKKQDDYFAGLFSRLANTGGQIKIEGVPMYRTGWFWKLCKALFNITDEFEDSRSPAEMLEANEYEIPMEIVSVFEKIKITIDDAVKEGVVPARMREFFKKAMPPAKFRQTFMAEFLEPEGAIYGKFPEGEHEVEQW